VVHNCPAVTDAARSVAGAAIDWVVEEPFAAIAAMHPAVRRVIPVRVRAWRRQWWRRAAWSELGEFRRELAAERYDAVVDTQSLLKSALIARLASGTRHGMDAASAREPLASWFYQERHPVARGLHAVERNRRLSAAALGYSLTGPAEYGLRPVARAGEVKLYAVFLTMTSRADKLWDEAKWIELGRALGAELVLPWGSDAERARAERIAAALPRARVPARRALGEIAELLARAQAVVGVDTGLTHLAAALGTHTVGIYCGTDPALTGLYGAPRAKNVGALGRVPDVGEVLLALR